jgi:hypothetical protein
MASGGKYRYVPFASDAPQQSRRNSLVVLLLFLTSGIISLA